MAKRKVCKSCNVFVTGSECPLCKSTQFTESWKGRIAIVDLEKSEIAKRVGKEKAGEYAIKVR